MSTSHDLSIRAELESISSKHGATDLISLLLKNYAIEMKESRRNLLTSSLLLSRSKQAFLSIEALIDNVNSTALSDFAAAWTDFENYTEAIPVLEDILFEFYVKIPEGLQNTAKTHTPPADVTEGLIFIEYWIKDRQTIVNTLASLSSSLPDRLPTIANELKGQWRTERRTDDLATFKALFDRLVALKPTDRWVSQSRRSQPVSPVLAGYQKIFRDMMNLPPQADTWVVFTMKTMALVLIPFEILSPASAHQDKASFRSHEIWTKMKELLVAVSAANHNVDPTPELESQWTSLRDLLLSLGGSISLVQDFLVLVQKAASVRRPFHGRSVRLIQMIRVLETHVSKSPNSNDERVVLGLMKDVALPLLTKAEQAVSDIQQYRIDSDEYKGMVSEFHSAITALENCYQDFELDAQWEKQKQTYDDVVTNTDEKHLTDFLARMSIAN